MPIRKLFFVPLVDYEAPALLLVQAFSLGTSTIGEAWLLQSSPSADGLASSETLRSVPGDYEEEMFNAMLVRIEPHIAALVGKVPIDRRSKRLMYDAPLPELSARLSLGQYPHVGSSLSRSRDAGLSEFVNGIGRRLHAEPIRF